VGGVLCDGTGCKIQIVRQEDLEKAKNEFKALTSEHVYSVQKAKTLPDLGVLYAVDVHMRDENEESKRLVYEGGLWIGKPKCIPLAEAFSTLRKQLFLHCLYIECGCHILISCVCEKL
jgi:hypothetical protein